MKPNGRQHACYLWWPTSPPPRATSEPASKQLVNVNILVLAPSEFSTSSSFTKEVSLNSSPQVPAFIELAKLGHSAERCNSTFLLVEAKPSHYLLNPTIWSNYTWPAWLCSQSTCESTHLFQSKPPLGTEWEAPFPCIVQISEPPPLNFPNQERVIARFIRPGNHPVLHSAPVASLYPRDFLCLHTIREPGWPSENSQSTDTALEIIDNPDLLRKLWIFKLKLWKLWIFQLKIRMKRFHVQLLK